VKKKRNVSMIMERIMDRHERILGNPQKTLIVFLFLFAIKMDRRKELNLNFSYDAHPRHKQ
jgi:hypothetical protein